MMRDLLMHFVGDLLDMLANMKISSLSPFALFIDALVRLWSHAVWAKPCRHSIYVRQLCIVVHLCTDSGSRKE
jgi:hypothetical protein